jgi:hypothetical protein
VPPRKRTDQRGEKSTALIYRTKTSFVNRSGAGSAAASEYQGTILLSTFLPLFHSSEFSTELLEAILVIWLLAQTGLAALPAESVSFSLELLPLRCCESAIHSVRLTSFYT